MQETIYELNIDQEYDMICKIYIKNDLQKEFYYKEGILNRRGKPAYIKYNISSGDVEEEYYFQSGNLHNEDDFSIKRYYCENKPYQFITFKNNKKDGLELKFDYLGNEIERIFYKDNKCIEKSIATENINLIYSQSSCPL